MMFGSAGQLQKQHQKPEPIVPSAAGSGSSSPHQKRQTIQQCESSTSSTTDEATTSHLNPNHGKPSEIVNTAERNVLSAIKVGDGRGCVERERAIPVDGTNVDPAEDGQRQRQPAHYGSTSTTYSTGSSNFTGSSFGTSGLLLDQSSSSGVATMSSTDHLFPATKLSRNLAEEGTPTMSTLFGGTGCIAELQRELEPLFSGVVSTIDLADSASAATVGVITAATTFSTLSLNATAASSLPTCCCSSSSSTSALLMSTAATIADSASMDANAAANFDMDNPAAMGGLLASHGQAHSTPSLLLAYGSEAGAAMAKPTCWSGGREVKGTKTAQQQDGSAKVGDRLITAAAERRATTNDAGNGKPAAAGAGRGGGEQEAEEGGARAATTEAIAQMASQLSFANTSTIALPSSSSPSSSHHSLLSGTSPLPSMFNCAATSCSQIFCTPLRTIVSQNRRRYQMDGFNLDLTYITDRIIAMGYPADTKEALYRNSMSHIVKFLEHYHPGHYKVFNLRGQYVYDPANFHNRVVSFEMTDHHPPRLELMAPFCREVHDYLEADPQNVVAVHCKAGKGRTGVMICAYLCYIAFYRIPRQNMDYYSIIRTHNNKGVTIPSQRRYVYYFSHLRNRNLNYMPLRCELVGVYIEKPPKLSGPFSKGALKVRVACGDVDIFLGDDLWLNGEKFDEEEELHRKNPLMAGEDQFDQLRFDPTKNCISRRCFGWTVPEQKRVFMEGDIRVDIFQKSQLKLFNVKQERKKIGHIWLNTMFTCPGFCGGQYIHGDEAYSYPDAMIVKKRLRRRQHCHGQPRSMALSEVSKSSSNCLPNTLAQSPHHHPLSAPANVAELGVAGTSSGEDSLSAGAISSSSGNEEKGPDKKAQQKNKDKSDTNPVRFGILNGISNVKRRAKSPGARQMAAMIEAEQMSWQSEDGEMSQKRMHHDNNATDDSRSGSRRQCRSSFDTAADGTEFEEEIYMERPPGLDAHCSADSLKAIYSANEKLAPRYGIEDIIRDAYQKNLVNDLYNARRMSQAREGPQIPKAPVGRPNASGPFCLMRRPEEHVAVFGVQEIDRAYKNKDIDLGFKILILTRCIDESNTKVVRLSEQFVQVTREKQAEKDAEKMDKMEQKQRKLLQLHHQQQNPQADNEKDGEPRECVNCLSVPGTSTLNMASVNEQQQQRQTLKDPRLNDPHLKKFFFRQRITSHSKPPNIHHHCPLRTINPKVCAKYGCSGEIENPATTSNQHDTQSQTNTSPGQIKRSAINSDQQRQPSKSFSSPICANPERKNEEGELMGMENGEEELSTFDDFDFFHPRQQTCSTVKDVGSNSTGTVDVRSPGQNETMEKRSKGTNCQTAIESDHKCHQSGGDRTPSAVGLSPNSIQRHPSGMGKWATPKDSVASAPISLSSDLTEPEIYHPSDCSLAPSSSSSCSSSM